MLLVLDDRISPLTDDIAIEAFEMLARAWREGKHLVTGHPEMLEALSMRTDLSQRARKTYKQLYVLHPQLSGLVKKVVRYVRVMHPDVEECCEIVGDQRELRLHLTHFADSSAIQKALLMGENIIDTDVFAVMGRAFASKQRLRALDIVAEKRGLGGSQAGTEYRRVTADGPRFGLCIADSDRKFFGDIPGKTAKDLLKSQDCLWNEIYVLHARELECLMPTRLIEEVCDDHPKRSPTRPLALSDLCELEQQHESIRPWRLFLDFKVGTTLHELYKLKKTFPVAWTNHGKARSATKSDHAECLERGSCDRKKDQCRCMLFAGFGDKLMADLCEKLEQKTPKKVCEYLCPATKTEWETIGALVFSWCCYYGGDRQIT